MDQDPMRDERVRDGRDGTPDEGDSRARQVLDRIMRGASERERAIFSQRTFGDEPILRTGADLRRERKAAASAASKATSAAAHVHATHADAADARPVPLPGTSGREERAALRRP
ncbi:hypothetical protein ACTQ13_03885, partial [Parafannyhessea sp. LCP21S3_E6]|uniref:hypothetical protein n=1 Tax=Parafannyhessea sp. LCP21S3_E6 TaxID=3438796 RepID=UPI003F992E40